MDIFSEIDIQIAAITLLALFIYMLIAYIIALAIKNNGLVDVFYGGGFALVSLVSLLFKEDVNLYVLGLNFLVYFWAFRLIAHLLPRFLRKWGEEDYRYANFRKNWKKLWLLRSFFQIYILQALVIIIISLPFIFVNLDSSVSSLQEDWMVVFPITGALIWLLGFYFEAIGDLQLTRFKSKPENKGKIMKTGVWALTRHPNYFGEVSMWWGVWIYSLALLPFSLGFISLVSPLLIAYLLLYVSGIPMLEKKYDDNPQYQEYKKNTPAFFPDLSKLLTKN